MKIKQTIKGMARAIGYDIVKYGPESNADARLNRILTARRINTVLDVGANIGQYGVKLREHGFKGRIVSFEPLKCVLPTLERNSKSYPPWDVKNIALGDKDCSVEINVSSNTASSSILDMLPACESAAPEARYVSKEQVIVRRLDGLFEEVLGDSDRLMLKIDAQGYERQVIEGVGRFLDRIDSVQIELSLVPLYEGAALFWEMTSEIQSRGFSLVSLEPVFVDKQSGRVLQVDGIFSRP